MTAPILYCGDTNLDGAASYLAGLMTHFGWQFDYVPSHVPVSAELIERPHSLLILSDYPSTQFDPDLHEIVSQQVEQGMGLLMIGGWESFHGLGGDWDGTVLGNLLPVEIGRVDDRINFDQPALMYPTGWNRELFDLPWYTRPPTIGGLNRIHPKSDAETWLDVTSFRPHFDPVSQTLQWPETGATFPALVTRQRSLARTAAFASDVAPHWVGGFVDWGPGRVKAQAAGAPAIEVGSNYAQFWRRLLAWTGRLE
ncbi:MAG: hypothetical protein JSS49_18795 [Planctomycetes bacterium]|nr:hypothetical protein [Planctomycetota bacterium]